MKFISSFLVLNLLFVVVLHAQNVGIGITSPTAGLHVVSDNGIVAKGTLTSGAVINEVGIGSRFIFNPRKGAVRGGYLDATGASYWNDANTGYYSIALGYNARATAQGSMAFGQSASALGINALALGYGATADVANAVAIGGIGTRARDQFSLALGNDVVASSYGSVAIGRLAIAGYSPTNLGSNCYAIGVGDVSDFVAGGHYATGTRSFVVGNNCRAVGARAFAIGNDCAAGQVFEDENPGRYSFAIGNSCLASGIFSFALGNNANTNGHIASMVLGSRIDGVSVNSPADYYFLAQFASGYQLQTNNAGTLGVYLNASSSSWLSLCDSNRKEQILPMDDEAVLQKLAAVDYASWKYKDDPDTSNRHYGIMAQDFYKSFGKDALGKIGSDTLVNPIDLLGVAYSAIKALEKRTAEITDLKTAYAKLEARLKKLEGE